MIEDIFGSRVGLKIILEFGRYPYKEFYLNELSKNLKIGLGRTKTILEKLEKKGVLEKKRDGNRILFKLNPSKQITFEVIRISNLNRLSSLPEEFKSIVEKFSSKYKEILKEELTSIVLFGSVAKGTAKKQSDIDILVIAKKEINKKRKEELRKIFSDILDIYFRISQEQIYTEKEFENEYSIGDDFLINIMNQGILVYDKDDFYAKHLIRGVPKITRKAIEKRLKIAKEFLDGCLKQYKEIPETVATMLGPISINLSRAFLLLNGILPGSKHDIPGQLKKINEKRFAEIYKKTKKWWDEMPLETDKEKVWKYLKFLEEKYNWCSKKIEEWA